MAFLASRFQAEEMENDSGWVLKNTFLEFDTTSCHKMERACSDSALYEGSRRKHSMLEVDDEDDIPTPRVVGHAQEVEFELTGLSDTETDRDMPQGAALPCYTHLKEGPRSGDSTPRSPCGNQGYGYRFKQEDEVLFTPSPRGEPQLEFNVPEAADEQPEEVDARSDPLKGISPPSGAAPAANSSAQEVEQLAAEVARLVKENEELRQSFKREKDTPVQSGVWGQSATPAWSFVAPTVQFCMPTTLAFAQEHSWGNAGQQVVHLDQRQKCASEDEKKRGRQRGARTELEEEPDASAGGCAQDLGKQKARGGKSRGSETVPSDTVCPDLPADQCTTVMLRNLPNNYTRDMLLQLLDNEGYKGKYNFLYLPVDFQSRACLGYAFINLVEPSLVQGFWEKFSGYCKWVMPSKKVCGVCWSGPHQGLEAHLERYRNSPVMHPSVPDEYKPVVFENGVRVSFPEPSKLPRAPRVRNHGDFKAHWSSAVCQKPSQGKLPATADSGRKPVAVGAVPPSS